MFSSVMFGFERSEYSLPPFLNRVPMAFANDAFWILHENFPFASEIVKMSIFRLPIAPELFVM
ncbi:MAG: hypothetical protein L6V90_08110 [Treponema succinifaciens]|nr:MAG: hypothetical protein L6V90_08110 [Treponema succinifaciens]